MVLEFYCVVGICQNRILKQQVTGCLIFLSLILNLKVERPIFIFDSCFSSAGADRVVADAAATVTITDRY